MYNSYMNDYIILTHWDHNQLTSEVRSKLRNGYVPVGGVSVASPNPGQYIYAQAMMKA